MTPAAPREGPAVLTTSPAMGSSALLLPAVLTTCPVVCQGLGTSAAPSEDMGLGKAVQACPCLSVPGVPEASELLLTLCT